MKRYQNPLVMLTLLALSVQSYADVLQTLVGAHHSTPKVVTQSENTIASRSVEINPYGKLTDVNQDQAEVVGIDVDQSPFIYGSGYHDSESNLEYMGARYYSADIGRFMAQDSYNLINRYNYANANPTLYVDPDGHSAVGDFFLSMIPGYGTYHAFANDRPWYEKALSIGVDVASFAALSYKLLSPSSVSAVSNAVSIDSVEQAVDNTTTKYIMGDRGEKLGNGTYGTVYGSKSDPEYVYKFFDGENISWQKTVLNKSEAAAQRTARVANKLQLNINAGFKLEVVGSKHEIVKMPFLKFSNEKDKELIDGVTKNLFEKDGRVFIDRNMINIGYYKGNPVIADVDQVIDPRSSSYSKEMIKTNLEIQQFYLQDIALFGLRGWKLEPI